MPNSMRFVFARATFALQCAFIALMLSSASTASAADRAACEVADRTIRAATPLSQCRTPSGDVLIGSGNCVNVFVDQSYTGTGAALGAITINAGGSLSVPDASVEIEAKSIIVVGVPGNGSAAQALLQIGTAACPIGTLSPDNHVTLRLTGERPAATKIHPHDHKSGDDCTTIDKGIGVGVNGQLRLFGARGVPPEGYSWTALSRPAGPSAYQVQVAHRNPDDSPDKIGAPVARGGELTLKLEHDVTKGANPWKTGDWIVVGTTNFSPFESEFVQIDHVSADGQGSQIVLNAATPLRHYHFGGPDPGPAHDIGSTPGTASRSFHLSQSHNFGVDERAEVGLISRNIQLTAATPKIAAAAIRPCTGAVRCAFARATTKSAYKVSSSRNSARKIWAAIRSTFIWRTPRRGRRARCRHRRQAGI